MKQTLIGLGLHELAFVVPLLLILAGLSSRRWLQLATGLAMAATGASILGRFL
jgi:hypothetical protein